MAMTIEQLDKYATEAGYFVTVGSPYSWWNRTYTKGVSRILVRHKGARLTDVAIYNGTGVVIHPTASKRQTVLDEMDINR